LAELGILEKLSVGMIHTLILTQIQTHVQDSCVGNFSSSQIEMLEKVLMHLNGLMTDRNVSISCSELFAVVAKHNF